jgi:hypothetical protein
MERKPKTLYQVLFGDTVYRVDNVCVLRERLLPVDVLLEWERDVGLEDIISERLAQFREYR